MSEKDEITFEEFKKSWLENSGVNSNNKLENGRIFASRLFIEWKQIDEDDADLTMLDGAGDGGLDVSYLERGTKIADGSTEEQEGDKLYLIQGKLGESDNNSTTIMSEFTKLLRSIENDNPRLAEVARSEFLRIRNFILKAKADHGDRLVWVFATVDTPSDASMHTIEEVRTLGNQKFKDIFDVEVISLRTLFARLEEANNESIEISMNGTLVNSGENVLIGSIKLVDLYEFLEKYRRKTGNLDQIFEKNVRMFLGTRKKVNKQIRETLLTEPEVFGLYNNGITIVSFDFEHNEANHRIKLIDPYIVNGCQTTKTIHDVFRQKYDTGGQGDGNDEWLKKIHKGNLLVKIVKTGSKEQSVLSSITKYTNSQNAVSVKDFTALDDNVRSWKLVFENKYGIFLEIQRGAWQAQKTYERLHAGAKRFSKFENVFDLIKVYSAGVLELPGLAYGKNDPFAPGGNIFKKITGTSINSNETITPEDLYAAHLLREAANRIGFGRRSEQLSRKQSRFLFYYSVLGILRRTFRFVNVPNTNAMVTKVLIYLNESYPSAFEKLMSRATDLIDEYLTQVENTGEISTVAFEEPAFKNEYNGDLNAFLKSPKLGKEDGSPNLLSLLLDYGRILVGEETADGSMKAVIKEASGN